MTERIDHAAEARDSISLAQDDALAEEATSITHAMIANAEANLALVEQQRIANLIALHRHEVEYDLNQGRSLLFESGTESLRPDITAALGIDEVPS